MVGDMAGMLKCVMARAGADVCRAAGGKRRVNEVCCQWTPLSWGMEEEGTDHESEEA